MDRNATGNLTSYEKKLLREVPHYAQQESRVWWMGVAAVLMTVSGIGMAVIGLIDWLFLGSSAQESLYPAFFGVLLIAYALAMFDLVRVRVRALTLIQKLLTTNPSLPSAGSAVSIAPEGDL